jgi:ketosteroid isomerase-like protein
MTPIEIVEGHYLASRDGDLDRAFAAIDDATEWTETAGSAYAGTFVGRKAIIENVFARIGAEWEGFGLDDLDLIASGDRVVATGWYVGTFRGTGASMRARFVHLWHVDGDRVARFEQVVDSATQNAAM